MNEITAFNDVIAKIQTSIQQGDLEQLPKLKTEAMAFLADFRANVDPTSDQSQSQLAAIDAWENQLSGIFTHVDHHLQDSKNGAVKSTEVAKRAPQAVRPLPVHDHWQKLHQQVDELEGQDYDEQTKAALDAAKGSPQSQQQAADYINRQLRNTQSFEQKAEQHSLKAQKIAEYLVQLDTHIKAEALKAEQKSQEIISLHQKLQESLDKVEELTNKVEDQSSKLDNKEELLKSQEEGIEQQLVDAKGANKEAADRLQTAQDQMQALAKSAQEITKVQADSKRLHQDLTNAHQQASQIANEVSSIQTAIAGEKDLVAKLMKQAEDKINALLTTSEAAKKAQLETVELKKAAGDAASMAGQHLQSINDKFDMLKEAEKTILASQQAVTLVEQEFEQLLNDNKTTLQSAQDVLNKVSTTAEAVARDKEQMAQLVATVTSQADIVTNAAQTSEASLLTIEEIRSDIRAKVQAVDTSHKAIETLLNESNTHATDVKKSIEDTAEATSTNLIELLANGSSQMQQLVDDSNKELQKQLEHGAKTLATIEALHQEISATSVKITEDNKQSAGFLAETQKHFAKLQDQIRTTKETAKEANIVVQKNEQSFKFLQKEQKRVYGLVTDAEKAMQTTHEYHDNVVKLHQDVAKVSDETTQTGAHIFETANEIAKNAADVAAHSAEINKKAELVTNVQAEILKQQEATVATCAATDKKAEQVTNLVQDMQDISQGIAKQNETGQAIAASVEELAKKAELDAEKASDSLTELNTTLAEYERSCQLHEEKVTSIIQKAESDLQKEEAVLETSIADKQAVLDGLIKEAQASLIKQRTDFEAEQKEYRTKLQDLLKGAQADIDKKVHALEEKQLLSEKRIKSLLSQNADENSPLKLAEATLDRAERLMAEAVAISESNKKSRFKRK